MDASANPSPKAKPWFGIWLSPAKVFSLLVALRDTNFMHRLMLAWSVSATAVVMLPSWLDPAIKLHPLEPLIQLLVMAPFAGLIAGYVFGAALKSCGSALGGKGTNDMLRMVNAWSWLPSIISHFACVIFYLASGTRTLFHPVNLGFLIAGVLWGMVIRHTGIREANQLSNGKSVLVQLLAFLLVMIPFVLIAFVYFSVLKGAFKIE